MPTPSIPLVAIGVTRSAALGLGSALKDTPYYLAAVLDYTETPPAYRYTPQHLGAVLHAVNPRPRALLTGTAVKDEALAEIEPVWREYADGALRDEGVGEGVWVKLSKWHATDGTPPPGIEEEVLRQLDGAFK